MRWLVLIGIVATAACTRANPAYGDGGTGGGTAADDAESVGDDAIATLDDDDDDDDASASVDDANPESGPDGSETGAGARPCCFPHPGIGCENGNVEECVCNKVPECCEVEWNDHCSQKARECDGECEVVDDGPLEGSTSAPPMTSDDSGSLTDSMSDSGSTSTSEGGSSTGSPGGDGCCDVHPTPSCDDVGTAACVCKTNSDCCKLAWTEECVGLAMNCPEACAL